MTSHQAQSAVSVSAFIVAAVYAYRKLVEGNTAKGKPVPPTGHFVLGFGFTYVVLSVLAQAAPDFGGMMAILVTTGDVLVNGQQLVGDITGNLGRTAQTTTGKSRGAGAKAGTPAQQQAMSTTTSGATGAGGESVETLPYTGQPGDFSTIPELRGDLPSFQPLF